jgi:serine/threonine protein kinase
MHDERGIMHGDIKPDNLLLVGSSFPCSPLPLHNYCTAALKVADFGLAKQLQVRTCCKKETRTNGKAQLPHCGIAGS